MVDTNASPTFNLHTSQSTESDLFTLWAHETQYIQTEPGLNLPLLNLVAKQEEMEVGAANCAAWLCTSTLRPFTINVSRIYYMRNVGKEI